MATTEEILQKILREMSEEQTPLLREILAQGKLTNGRVSKLEKAEDERTKMAQLKDKLREQGWIDPEHVPDYRDYRGGPSDKQQQSNKAAAGFIGTIVAAVVIAVSKGVGF